MLGMGFFELNGDRYHMKLPAELTLLKLKSALLRYAETYDDGQSLHPTDMVKTMSLAKPSESQARLN
jgi:hypothetical protein